MKHIYAYGSSDIVGRSILQNLSVIALVSVRAHNDHQQV